MPSKSNGAHLSPTEQRVLELIPSRGKTDTVEITKKFYSRREKPEHAIQVITNAVRRLEQKTRRGSVRVKRGPRVGPRPMEVWIERHG